MNNMPIYLTHMTFVLDTEIYCYCFRQMFQDIKLDQPIELPWRDVQTIHAYIRAEK